MTPISVAFSRPEQQPPWEILQELTAHGGDYLLVGAHARNIVCFGMAEVAEAAPRTHDVDIAIAVPRGEGGLAGRVTALDGPRRTSRLTYALPSLPGVPIDVIPYGPGVADVEDIPLDRAVPSTRRGWRKLPDAPSGYARRVQAMRPQSAFRPCTGRSH